MSLLHWQLTCTGLGGHDLEGPFNICIRIDKHGQSIYGPSVVPIDRRDTKTKIAHKLLPWAMYEFLVLHYLATDSAQVCVAAFQLGRTATLACAMCSGNATRVRERC